jgi:maleate isomerase
MTTSSGESRDCRLLQAAFDTRSCTDIGLLALASDHAIETEMHRLLQSDDVRLHVSRLASSNAVNMQNLAGIAEGIEAACSVLLPESRLSVIAYGCTSGTIAAGETRILNILKRLRPGCIPTTPITAALAAFEAMGISRLSVLTPYPRDVHLAVVDHLKNRGLNILQSAYFGVSEDRRITEIASESLESAVDQLADGDNGAVFVSCTALTIVDAIAHLERKTGRTIITSNQALAWHCLRLSGSNLKLPAYGRLFEF